MGLYDRDYTHGNFQSGHRHSPQMRISFQHLTPIVKRLLIINLAVFFAGIIIFRFSVPLQIGSHTIGVTFLERWFAVLPNTFFSIIQIWRLITYQFLHGSIFHLLFNMIGLFFLGPTLEKSWGSKRFLTFYLGCGIAGGLFYIFLAVIGFLPAGIMIGASGAILGMFAACAILFPHFVVFFIIFLVPIRIAVVVLTIIYIANVIKVGANAGGDAAHLAGMAAGAFYVFSQSWRQNLRSRVKSKRTQSVRFDEQQLQYEVDRILQKVHESGIHSLSSKEKKILKKATKAQQ